MAHVYTVSEITRYIRDLFSKDFSLARATVSGEVSNLRYHRSGHIYFTLKDREAELSAVMFSSDRKGLSFELRDGQQVEVSGRIGVYEKSGSYQLYARSIRLAGAGVLFEKFLLLREKLEEMGLFDEIYKKPIPKYALSIGIVTAIGGAAVRDIISVSKRRNPYVRLVLAPASVQGDFAAAEIAQAIERIDALGLDVLIVGRGGGSIEDLWAFNEEVVAQAIFNCSTPVISAVGHETDFCIADFVADLRAPTPSAAAEIANFVYSELDEELSAKRDVLRSLLEHDIFEKRSSLGILRGRLKAMNPKARLSERRERFSSLCDRMRRAAADRLFLARTTLKEDEGRLSGAFEDVRSSARHRAELLCTRLDGMSPLRKMQGGYSFLETKDGAALKSVDDIAPGAVFRAYLRDGSMEAVAQKVLKH